MLNEFTEANGYITGHAYNAAEAAFRREQREFERLCDALRKRKPDAVHRTPRVKPKPRATERSCWQCGKHFTHTERRGPAPRYCKATCRAAWHRAQARTIREAVAAQYKPRRSRGAQPLDLKGRRFGRLQAIEPVTGVRGSRPWRCRCDCGAECVVLTKRLRSGEAKSCGCLRGRPR